MKNYHLIVLGFLLGIVNTCLSSVAPILFLLLEARFGSLTVQNCFFILKSVESLLMDVCEQKFEQDSRRTVKGCTSVFKLLTLLILRNLLPNNFTLCVSLRRIALIAYPYFDLESGNPNKMTLSIALIRLLDEEIPNVTIRVRFLDCIISLKL